MAFKRRKKSTSKKTTKKDTMGKIKHIKTEIDGHIFDSKMESEYYEKLKADKTSGKILDFEMQVAFTLQDKFIIVDGQAIYGEDPDFNKIKRKTKAPTVQAIKYVADFLITDLDGSQRIVDTKGKSTPDFEIKKKMCICKYPQYKFEVLIYNKKTKTWDDYYEYNKALRKAKKEKKAESEK